MDCIKFFTEPDLLFDKILVQNDLLGDIVSFFSQSTKHSINGELLAADFLDIEIVDPKFDYFVVRVSLVYESNAGFSTRQFKKIHRFYYNNL